MASLYVRIYLTVLAALALFAGVSGWVVQRHLASEREEQRIFLQGAMRERAEAWGELLQRALPPAAAPRAEQAAALAEWSQRLRLPMALDDPNGGRIAASESFLRREAEGPGPLGPRAQALLLEDGRTLWVPRLGGMAGMGGLGGTRAAAAGRFNAETRVQQAWPGVPRGLTSGWGLIVFLMVLFLAVAAGAWPVVRRLTRRLEALKQGVEAFGAGALHQRVAEDGRDEVAAVGASFNRAAGRIEALLRSHQTLLANASHELRSPLARLKMATAMMEDAAPPQRALLRREVETNIAELDALVEEVLLASRLDATAQLDVRAPVSLLALAAEEAARVGALAQGDDVSVPGDDRLLRRALRNLLENARRYGGGSDGSRSEGDIEVRVQRLASGGAEVRVCDRGAGVPEAYRERIFEAFFRLPGHAERAGGVGLGLSLVRQIAERHGGRVRCEPREGGGSCFVLELPGA